MTSAGFKMRRIHAWLLTTALTAGLAGPTSLLRGQSPEQDHAPQQQPAEQAQTFSGKISRKGDKYVLRDTSTKVTYNLDDQEKAKSFAGKSVDVTGTLDAQTYTIHVADIQPSA